MNGFVIGKFNPPHKGHSFLIRTALAATDRLTVVLCGEEGQDIPASVRAGWLRSLFPSAEVIVLDTSSFDTTSETAWTDATKRVLGTVPELMFSSEGYGPRYASLLGCEHVLVDKDRLRVPVSSRRIWEEPALRDEFLEGPVRDYFRKASPRRRPQLP